jgi:hypothetical protein
MPVSSADPLGRVLAGVGVPAEGDDAGDGAVGDDLREAVAVEVADRRGAGGDDAVHRDRRSFSSWLQSVPLKMRMTPK